MQFLNQSLGFFNKGRFEPIDRNSITESYQALKPIEEIQNKYNKHDNDSFLNELRDSMVALYLDYELINIQKHGLDAKRSLSDEFLEIKQVSFQSKTWSATFNDTTLEKAKVFCDIKTTLAVGVWNNISNLLFIVYGKHPEMGLYLEQKVKECHNESRRSTKTIGVSKLIKEFDFKMKPIDLKEQIKELSQKEHFNFLKNYNLVDEKGEVYFAKDLSTPSNPRSVAIQEINLFLEPLKSRGWSSDEKLKELYYQNRLIFKNNRPYEKYYLKESQDNCLSVLDFYSRQGTKDLEKLGLKGLFKTPKPVELIKYLLLCSTPKDSIILDFFAGSGTTAQAVIEVNKDYDLNWSFYLCQKEEKIKNNPQAISILKNKGHKNTISNIMLLRLEKIIKSHEYEILKTKSILF